MKTTTQKQLKEYEQIQSISLHLGSDWNVDTGKHLYSLKDKHILAVSAGRYGVNGALIQFTNQHSGKPIILSIVGRTPELFQLL